jgi:hypothetical protein
MAEGGRFREGQNQEPLFRPSGTLSRKREKGKSGGSGGYRCRRRHFPASTHGLIQPLQHL